mmetsp:Transcript_16824/g.58544  ORF Transcript_16824/g.58544 Transcript_16824/m.58544 type:complete len:229 (+) Transcript_16824:885-1571(+)
MSTEFGRELVHLVQTYFGRLRPQSELRLAVGFLRRVLAAADGAAQLVVQVRGRVRPVEEQALQVVRRKVVHLLLVLDDVLQALLGELALQHALLERARGDQAVGEALHLLAVAPAPCRRLFVSCRVPVQVEHDEPRPADEVQPAAAGLAAEQKCKVAALPPIKLVVELLPFLRRRRPAELAARPALRGAHGLEQVQRRRVDGDHDDSFFRARCLAKCLHQAVQHAHLA